MTDSRLVLVEWLDSHRQVEWSRGEVDLDLPICRSVGWLVAESASAVAVAPHMTVEDDPQRCGMMVIPRPAVVRIVDITSP